MSRDSDPLFTDLAALRRDLHLHPELAGEESDTSRRIADYVADHAPASVVRGLGGHGLAVVYEGASDGPTLLLRADLDALPTQEDPTREHRSRTPGVAHLCGHDGHAALLAGLAPLFARERPARGRVVLLFQPAEETGEGAAAVLDDPAFAPLRPDVAVGVHNLPGFGLGEVVLCEGGFAFASMGVAARLEGVAAHAAEPRRGQSPAPAAAELIDRWMKLAPSSEDGTDERLLTLVHVRVGEPGYGTAPGEAEVLATCRAETDDGLDALAGEACAVARETAGRHGVGCRIDFHERFPALRNDRDVNEAAARAASAAGLTLVRRHDPFPWSEDFGRFTARFPGAMIGLGAGRDLPALHRPDYEFPDALLPVGVKLLHALARDLLG